MRNSNKMNAQIKAVLFIAILPAIVSHARGQTVFPATSPTTAPSFTRAVLVERYDEDGVWRKVPRKAIITGELADRLGKCFPELDTEKPEGMTVTHQPIRFEITLTRTNGKEVTVWINPELRKWWDEDHVYRLDYAAPLVVLEAAKGAREDESLVLHFPPAVKVEIIEREDEFMRWRQIPRKVTYDGLQAEYLARGFPEIGLKRVPQLADGGKYRFEIDFTRENGERVKVFVFDNPGEKWSWYEGHSYWELSSDTAGLLVSLCRDAKEDPSAALKGK